MINGKFFQSFFPVSTGMIICISLTVLMCVFFHFLIHMCQTFSNCQNAIMVYDIVMKCQI